MSKNLINNSKLKTITTRLSNQHYTWLLDKAEDEGTTIADINRNCIAESIERGQLTDALKSLEQNIISKTFEMLVAVAGIDEQQYLVARRKYAKAIANSIIQEKQK